MDISGASVLVTGGASGLGAATARHFASAGAEVFALDLKASIEKAEAVEGVSLFDVDVTDEEGVQNVISTIESSAPPLRAVINCAGVAWASRILGREGPHTLDLFRKVLEINVVGSFNVLRLGAASIAKNDPVDEAGQRGVIINTASVAAFEGQIGQAAYASSKGAIHALTISAARDLAKSGIRVVTIAPGTMETPMLAGITEEFRATLSEAVVFPQRLGKPEEYAALAAFIISHDYLNGETIRMDGAIRMAPR